MRLCWKLLLLPAAFVFSQQDLTVHNVSFSGEEATHSRQLLGSKGSWSNVIGMPIIPVALANTPSGRIEAWAASDKLGWNGGRTYTCTFDPTTNRCSEQLVRNTNHDMFCPGM